MPKYKSFKENMYNQHFPKGLLAPAKAPMQQTVSKQVSQTPALKPLKPLHIIKRLKTDICFFNFCDENKSDILSPLF